MHFLDIAKEIQGSEIWTNTIEVLRSRVPYIIHEELVGAQTKTTLILWTTICMCMVDEIT